MQTNLTVTPTYASGDLARILEIEQCQVEGTVADLDDVQMEWRPHPKAKSALDILWHLSYPQLQQPRPAGKDQALRDLRTAYELLQREIAAPGKLDMLVGWWTGEEIPFRGVVWGAIRHRTYHLGELLYLRQAMGLNGPVYCHE